MGSSDEALLAGLAAGDEQAAAAFVRRFQRRAYGLARTIVGNPRDAEDVAQDAFVRAWRYAAGYDPRRGTVLTWLLTIVRNVAVDRARLKSAEPLDPDVLASKLQLEAAASRGRTSRSSGSASACATRSPSCPPSSAVRCSSPPTSAARPARSPSSKGCPWEPPRPASAAR